MPSVPEILSDAVERALGAPAMIRTCADPKFGDYQANGIMAVAKQRKENPRSLAEKSSLVAAWATWPTFSCDAPARIPRDALMSIQNGQPFISATRR